MMVEIKFSVGDKIFFMFENRIQNSIINRIECSIDDYNTNIRYKCQVYNSDAEKVTISLYESEVRASYKDILVILESEYVEESA